MRGLWRRFKEPLNQAGLNAAEAGATGVGMIMGSSSSRRQSRRFVRRMDPTGPRMTLALCGFIVSIPLASLFLGYSIGHYLMGPPRRMPDDHVVVEHFMLNQSLRNMHHLAVDLHGGLGNLMFMYCSMYGTARINGLIPLIPDRHYLSSIFPNLWADVVIDAHPGKRWPKFRERNPNMYDRRTGQLNFMKNIELEGFFQSWRYFEEVKKDIKDQLRFGLDIEEACREYLKEAYVKHLSNFKEKEVVFVGIHVRRGDLTDAYNVDRGYVVAPPGYIRKAMDYFANKYKNVIFIVCSDDKKWARANIGSLKNLVVFSPYSAAAMDLCLLSRSNHTIMTVGTFGWWGSWMAGGETIYYKDFPARGSQISHGFVPSDYFYTDWIAL